MKKILLFVILIIDMVALTNAQSVQWLNSIQYSYTNSPAGIATDPSGNVYTAGTYERGPFPSNPRGVYITKYNNLGNLLWEDTVNSWSGSRGIVVDSLGNAYTAVSCNTASTLTFGGYSFTNLSGVMCLYLVKYNATGTVMWAKQIVNTDAKGIAIDHQGNVYPYGRVITTTSFDSYTVTAPGNFIAKYDSSGNCNLAFSSAKYVGNVSFDGADNIYLIDLAGLSSPLYLKKYNSSGALQWSKWLPTDVVVYTDLHGDCYFRGTFNGSTFTWGSTTLTNTTASSWQWFVGKMDANGNFLWAFTPTDASSFYGFHLTSTGNILLTGNSGWAYGASEDGTSEGLFVAQYDTNGVFISKNTYIPGTTGMFMASYNSDIYITGESFAATCLCGTFITKIGNNITTGITNAENNSDLLVFPNPANETFQISYSSTEKTKLQLNVFNSKGEVIYSQTVPEFQGEYKKAIDLSNRSKGVYLIEIIADKKRSVKRIILN